MKKIIAAIFAILFLSGCVFTMETKDSFDFMSVEFYPQYNNQNDEEKIREVCEELYQEYCGDKEPSQ